MRTHEVRVHPSRSSATARGTPGGLELAEHATFMRLHKSLGNTLSGTALRGVRLRAAAWPP